MEVEGTPGLNGEWCGFGNWDWDYWDWDLISKLFGTFLFGWLDG